MLGFVCATDPIGGDEGLKQIAEVLRVCKKLMNIEIEGAINKLMNWIVEIHQSIARVRLDMNCRMHLGDSCHISYGPCAAAVKDISCKQGMKLMCNRDSGCTCVDGLIPVLVGGCFPSFFCRVTYWKIFCYNQFKC